MMLTFPVTSVIWKQRRLYHQNSIQWVWRILVLYHSLLLYGKVSESYGSSVSGYTYRLLWVRISAFVPLKRKAKFGWISETSWALTWHEPPCNFNFLFKPNNSPVVFELYFWAKCQCPDSPIQCKVPSFMWSGSYDGSSRSSSSNPNLLAMALVTLKQNPLPTLT